MVEILSMIAKGGKSVRDMAKELAINKDALEFRLDSLVRSGYIRELKFMADCSTGRCRDCPMGKTCSDDTHPIPRVFELTEKGYRVLEREKK
jgi:hypothetical protein